MKHLIFKNKDGYYFNVCVSHDYCVETEYSKDLGKLLFSLHDIYNIFSSDSLPEAKDVLSKLEEAKQVNPDSRYICTVEYTKPYSQGIIKTERAYQQILKGYLKKNAFFFCDTIIELGCGTKLSVELDYYLVFYFKYCDAYNNLDE